MAIKTGSSTTEYKEAKSAGLWGVVAMLLGVVISVGGAVAPAFGVESKSAIIAGALVSTAGIIQKTLTSMGYIKSRTDVKRAK